MIKISEEAALIKLIATRASRLYLMYGSDVKPDFVESELKMVHYEICKLQLQELLDAGVNDFIHDITGIHEHLDMLNGSFRNDFVPWFKQPTEGE